MDWSNVWAQSHGLVKYVVTESPVKYLVTESCTGQICGHGVMDWSNTRSRSHGLVKPDSRAEVQQVLVALDGLVHLRERERERARARERERERERERL
jgi:hypothetical protein